MIIHRQDSDFLGHGSLSSSAPVKAGPMRCQQDS
jgi:hypothetical protein